MNKTHALLAGLALCLVTLLLYCAKDDSSGAGPSNNTTPNDDVQFSATYTVVGNQLITVSDQQVYVYHYCLGDSLVTAYDTNYAATDTITFSQVGDSLMVYGDAEGSTDTGFADPAARVEMVNVYARQSGSGLIGTWKPARAYYRILAGTLTPDEQQQLDDEVASLNADVASGNVPTVEITTSRITVYAPTNDNWADDFIANWNSGGALSDSARFDITVVKVNATSVRLTGNVTGEVVTISYTADVSVTYSSSNTANAAGTVYENPTTCPNSRPAWYQTFRQANRRTTPKAAEAETEQPQPPYSIQQMLKHHPF